jgi:hypothetical protein
LLRSCHLVSIHGGLLLHHVTHCPRASKANRQRPHHSGATTWISNFHLVRSPCTPHWAPPLLIAYGHTISPAALFLALLLLGDPDLLPHLLQLPSFTHAGGDLGHPTLLSAGEPGSRRRQGVQMVTLTRAGGRRIRGHIRRGINIARWRTGRRRWWQKAEGRKVGLNPSNRSNLM